MPAVTPVPLVDRTAGRAVWQWLDSVRGTLAMCRVPEALAAVLAEAFPYPLGDAAYQGSTLVPRDFPLEVSFSELTPDAFRFDFEPIAVSGDAPARRHWTIPAYRRLAAAAGAAHAFVPDVVDEGAARFGAYLGVALTRERMTTANLYLPCWTIAGHSPTQVLARAAVDAAPELEPRFQRWSTSESTPERVYLTPRRDLSIAALRNVIAAVGLGHRAVELTWPVTALTDGAPFLLAERTVVSVGSRDGSCELKLELLVNGWPQPAAMVAAAMHLLRERPPGFTAFHRWRRAVSVDADLMPAHVTAIGVRVFAGEPLHLGIYAAPPLAPVRR